MWQARLIGMWIKDDTNLMVFFGSVYILYFVCEEEVIIVCLSYNMCGKEVICTVTCIQQHIEGS